MKHYILAFFLLFFSLIGGVIGSFGIYYYILGGNNVLTNNIVNNDIQENIISKETRDYKPTSQVKELENLEKNIIHLVKETSLSVVSIIIKKDLIIYRSDPWGFFQQPSGTIQRQVGGGSGFFIRKDGLILTNKHVVQDRNAEYTVILHDGSEYTGNVLAFDPVNDLAIIKIEDENMREFPVLPLIKNTESVAVGSFAIAIGNALAEFQNSVSLGIVSGKNRNIEAEGTLLSGLIQTDAAINPGNSGGPLLNLNGEIIGVNTAIASRSSGIGFSIALSRERVDYMIHSIEKNGNIKRPFIGINYIENSPGVAEELGLSIDYGIYIIDESGSIIPGSAAEKAGLSPGDIILEINGTSIKESNTLNILIQNSLPGETLTLKVQKKSGEQKEVKLILGEY